MTTDDIVYERLAEALDKLPNAFPRTASNVEIKILKKIFSPEEASVACQLSGSMEPLDVILGRSGLSPEQTKALLRQLAESGRIWHEEEDGIHYFRLAPFIVGIYEASDIDHELAHLVEDYLSNGGAEGIMRPQPAIHRVVPAHKAIKTERILPYEDVKALLEGSKSFTLNDCICRVQQKHMGHECEFPVRSCLSFSNSEDQPKPSSISKEAALAFLDKAEEIGFVHTVSNIMKGRGYVCNCCGCCCGLLRGITDWGIENSVASSSYYAEINADECASCGICVDRCQVHAISQEGDVPVIDRERCIGCGLCVTGCESGAAKLVRKPEEEIVLPPADLKTWEQERLRNRSHTG